MSSVDEALQNMRALLVCRLCGGQLRATVTLQECGHHFCHTCVYSQVGSTCRCPTCHLPARVGNLLKNPTYDILVACASKLVDLRRDVSPAVDDDYSSQPNRPRHGKENGDEDRDNMDEDIIEHGTPLGSVIWTADCGPTFPHSEPLHLTGSSLSSSMDSSNVDPQTFPSLNAALANHGREKILKDRKKAEAAAVAATPTTIIGRTKDGRSSSQPSGPSSVGSSNVDMQTFPSVDAALVIHGREKALRKKTARSDSTTTAVNNTGVLVDQTVAGNEATNRPAEVEGVEIIPTTAQRDQSRGPAMAPSPLELASTSLSIPAPGADIVSSRPNPRPTISQLQSLLNIRHHKNQQLREESCVPSSQENEDQTQVFPLQHESEQQEQEEMSYHTPRMPSMRFYSPLLPDDPQSGLESENESSSSSTASRKRVATTTTGADQEYPLSAVKKEFQDQDQGRDRSKRRSVDKDDRITDRRPRPQGATVEVQSSQPSADLLSPSHFY
ncbi:hypothetical protein EMPS_03455 [Entomortierella parvispora]|uniref:RING-type domain-containing protein n=1 Tax=Entomortierella parvispora TaxID=205924 RepID=A0A9P3H6U9_9FUNG|nr:hypothetical protein EMPS_03455 [Entomortierella parvispora]